MRASNSGKEGETYLKDYLEIYTPLSVAKEEIKRRWNDKQLRKKVENFLDGDLPDFLRNKKEPRAVFCRDIISPITEFYLFWDLAKCASLKPALVEYTDTKFVAKNQNKYHLCKMYFYKGIGKKGGEIIDSKRIVDFNKYEGKKFKDIKTLWGENLIDFHHKILKKNVPNLDKKSISDFSDWFNKHRSMSEYYYLHYLALFLVHGILFENFLTSKKEADFTKKIVVPGFRKLYKLFGIKPLIVPIASKEGENERFLWYFPEKVKSYSKIK